MILHICRLKCLIALLIYIEGFPQVTKIFRGDRLKEVRELRGLTQVDLGERAGMSHIQVYRYETGRNEPSPDMIARFAKALDVTADYLLGLVDLPTDHLKPQDLSPTEARLLDAFRRGDLRDAMDVWSRES